MTPKMEFSLHYRQLAGFFLLAFRGKLGRSLGPASVAGRPKHMSPCVKLTSDPPQTTPPLLNLPVTVVALVVM